MNTNSDHLNLGLSTLVTEESKVSEKSIQLCAKSLTWLEVQLKRPFVSKTILASFLSNLKQSYSDVLEINEYQERYKELFKCLGAPVEAATKIVTTEKIATVASKSNQPKEDSSSKVRDESDWQKFSKLVASVPKTEPTKLATSHTKLILDNIKQKYLSHKKLVNGSIVALVAIIIILNISQSNTLAKESIAFIREPKSNLSINLEQAKLDSPRVELINGVGALTSLAYEMLTAAPKARSVRAQQVVAPQAEMAPIEAPVAQAREKIAIGPSTEPAEIRDIQEQPEDSVQENVIDFPPFVHRKPGADDKAPHDELERFESTRRYTITAATQIMSSPSYWAPKLGILNPGEIVNVEAKIGVWLRIRNRAGNISYILAQDAAAQ